MMVFLSSEMTCAVVGNWYIHCLFLRLISRLTKIKIFNRPAALLNTSTSQTEALSEFTLSWINFVAYQAVSQGHNWRLSQYKLLKKEGFTGGFLVNMTTCWYNSYLDSTCNEIKSCYLYYGVLLFSMWAFLLRVQCQYYAVIAWCYLIFLWGVFWYSNFMSF